ncbi:MAG: yccM 1 [Firmicutes bacterium]|nr:yccM 1 [Bacillota bacterium]
MLSKIFIKRQLQFWRFVFPVMILILSLYSLEETKYPRSEFANIVLWLSRMDPLLLIAHMGSALVVPDWIWLPILVILATAFIGRVFCGWLCPLGGLLNFVYYGRRLFPKGLLVKTDKNLPSFFKAAKYWWLTLIVVFASAGAGISSVFTPLTFFSHEITKLYLGQFPWLLAAAILSGFIFFPRFWCTYVCPTGILFTLIAGWHRVKVRVTGKCVNCDYCKSVCPVNAVDTGPKGSGEECLVCGRCWAACSRQAISWTLRRQASAASDMQSRRNFLKLGTAIAVGSLINLPARRLIFASPSASPSLRPPGAVPENDFLATCNRCSRCVKVCPTGGLVPMPFSSGIMTYETPELIPRKGCCELCMLCSKVCPTGAIRPIKRLEVKIGVARLDEGRCLAWTQGKACLICKERCPVDAIIIDDSKRPYINSRNCIGCGACENACPVEETAVKVVID